MIKVSAIDDHLLILKGLADMIGHIDTCKLMTSYASIGEARIGLADFQPDVLLLDINLPDGDGIEFCREVKKAYPDIKTLGLSTYDHPQVIKGMVRNGATGFLLKTVSLAELKIAIETAATGTLYIQAELKNSLALSSLGKPSNSAFAENLLTRRESEILNLIAEGLTSQQIADQLFIALKTVETHRCHIMEKVQVNNTASLIKIAIERGLVG